MVPVPGPHAGLTFHQIGDNFKLLGINIAVSVQVKHLEGYLKIATGGTQNSQEEYVIREGN